MRSDFRKPHSSSVPIHTALAVGFMLPTFPVQRVNTGYHGATGVICQNKAVATEVSTKTGKGVE